MKSHHPSAAPLYRQLANRRAKLNSRRLVTARITEIRSDPAKASRSVGTFLTKLIRALRESALSSRTLPISISFEEIAAITALIDVQLTDDQLQELLDHEQSKVGTGQLFEMYEEYQKTNQKLLLEFMSVWDYAFRMEKEYDQLAEYMGRMKFTSPLTAERKKRRPACLSWTDNNFMEFDPNDAMRERIVALAREHDILVTYQHRPLRDDPEPVPYLDPNLLPENQARYRELEDDDCE